MKTPYESFRYTASVRHNEEFGLIVTQYVVEVEGLYQGTWWGIATVSSKKEAAKYIAELIQQTKKKERN